MADEITIKDLYDIIDKRFTKLEGNIEKYHDSFIRFEEGKLTQALQDIEKSKGDILLLQGAMQKSEIKDSVNADRIKVWIWEALEKIIFMIIIPLIGLILIKLGIVHLN